MDNTKEFTNKAMMGDEQAIEVLHLSNATNVDNQKPKQITKDTFERINTSMRRQKWVGNALE